MNSNAPLLCHSGRNTMRLNRPNLQAESATIGSYEHKLKDGMVGF